MTKISWTHRPGTKGETWNPVVGCSVVSAGCTNCYAMRAAYRLEHAIKVPQYMGTTKMVNGNPVWTGRIGVIDRTIKKPLRWKKPRTVFVNSMGDLFHEAVPFEAIDRIWAVMAMTPQHTYIVLTKRPDRMQRYLTDTRGSYIFGRAERTSGGPALQRHWPLPNVWVGTSAENQATADERIPHLLATPAAIRLVSCEPLLGPVDISYFTSRNDLIGRPALDWVISGDESGPGARFCNIEWHRTIKDQCFAAGVAYFHKQRIIDGQKVETPELDGRTWTEFPA